MEHHDSISAHQLAARFLQDRKNESTADRGRFIFTVLYLSILAFCFVIPLLYYIRCYFESRREQRLARLESERMRTVLEQSTQVNRAESLAAKRKYLEERKARIMQLMVPVKLTLKEEDFVERMTDEMQTKNDPYTDQESDDEESFKAIRVPAAGLYMDEPCCSKRVVAGTCTICLTPYEIGSSVVWSSNKLCEHVFHVECAEQWLLRQRDGPLCPCCRRDFIVDPYDVENGIVENAEEARSEAVSAVDDADAVGVSAAN
ncbi:hypothetical protein MPSEU_000338200 [Mayamaea pseudoterrestris]|nr:hypothetical protein MPSEU_000338200 [Mayamaea pseudoterrestris]